jgi:hypothetical protein
MQPNLLAYIRVFEYVLVIIAAMFLIKKTPNCVICVANVLIAAFLCYNAIQYINGVPNSPSFQWAITIFVGLWALAHIIELSRGKNIQ